MTKKLTEKELLKKRLEAGRLLSHHKKVLEKLTPEQLQKAEEYQFEELESRAGNISRTKAAGELSQFDEINFKNN
jgi:hypothetical protein